jgi:flagellar M-ring protein FliF
MGIEMIQKDSALGTSSMMETARYQSVLETELARTIIKVQGVQSARVHLALPKAVGVSARFAQGDRIRHAAALSREAPGARPGRRDRAPGRIERPGTRASDVTVVDQAGSLLNSPDETAEAAPAPGSSNTRASSRRAINGASSSCWSPWSEPAACARR